MWETGTEKGIRASSVPATSWSSAILGVSETLAEE
jgi:hypothetical protein